MKAHITRTGQPITYDIEYNVNILLKSTNFCGDTNSGFYFNPKKIGFLFVWDRSNKLDCEEMSVR